MEARAARLLRFLARCLFALWLLRLCPRCGRPGRHCRGLLRLPRSASRAPWVHHRLHQCCQLLRYARRGVAHVGQPSLRTAQQSVHERGQHQVGLALVGAGAVPPVGRRRKAK